MKIIYIKIKNFKSISELEINDIENALILVGKNNTGKTSIIDAILLASNLKAASEHEFLDINKPIEISMQIEFTEDDLNYYYSRGILCKANNFEKWFEEFKEKMFGSEKFVDYIITYTNHMPFSPEKGNCKMLLDLDSKENENVSYDLTEEDCARRQAKETDYMMELLVKELKERELFDKTTIVVLTDHYLYTLSDKSILDKYKNTSNNLINHTPFFIYTNNKDKKTIKTVTSQLNVLPTVLNLFGIDYNPNYYIGQDALSNNYQKLVFFSDYSWYDGNVYVDGGVVTNNKYINQNALEEKNYNVNYLIKKNDLTLKYNYFKDMEKSSK